MASTTTKQACTKCNKGGGIAMCNGCERSFCVKHFVEHRQELSQQMDGIAQEHDLLRQDMNSQGNGELLLKQIDQWEQKAIEQIQAHARKVRLDLRQLLEQRKNQLQTSVNKLTEELRSCRESDDYTELEMKRWTEQIETLRQRNENSLHIHTQDENSPTSVVPLIGIRILEQLSVPMDTDNTRIIHQSLERFAEITGNIKLLADGLIAYCSEFSPSGSYTSGMNRYSRGIHRIHFQINKKNSQYLFFGITSASEKFKSDMSTIQSMYGWWDLNYTVVDGVGTNASSEKTIQKGDKLTLVLNCDQHLIQLKHHRTNRSVELPIDLQQCPYPWKIVVRLDSPSDSVTIVH